MACNSLFLKKLIKEIKKKIYTYENTIKKIDVKLIFINSENDYDECEHDCDEYSKLLLIRPYSSGNILN